MKKAISVIAALLLALSLAACQPGSSEPSESGTTLPTESTAPSTTAPTEASAPSTTATTEPSETEPSLTVEYPLGDGHSAGDEPLTIWYVEGWMDIYADKIGSYECEYGFQYYYDEDTGDIIQLCDATYECMELVSDHIFFSSNGGQLTHYVPATGERTVLHQAESGFVVDIEYFNDDGNPVLYLLEGETLARFDLLTGETAVVGVFECPYSVCVSPANPDLVSVEVPYGWTILDTATGESVYVESEGGWLTFYNDGIMPENEERGLLPPAYGVLTPEERRNPQTQIVVDAGAQIEISVNGYPVQRRGNRLVTSTGEECGWFWINRDGTAKYRLKYSNEYEIKLEGNTASVAIDYDYEIKLEGNTASVETGYVEGYYIQSVETYDCGQYSSVNITIDNENDGRATVTVVTPENE